MEDFTVVDNKVYAKLLADSELLEALRAQGVDNWDGWYDAIESLNDDSSNLTINGEQHGHN